MLVHTCDPERPLREPPEHTEACVYAVCFHPDCCNPTRCVSGPTALDHQGEQRTSFLGEQCPVSNTGSLRLDLEGAAKRLEEPGLKCKSGGARYTQIGSGPVFPPAIGKCPAKEILGIRQARVPRPCRRPHRWERGEEGTQGEGQMGDSPPWRRTGLLWKNVLTEAWYIWLTHQFLGHLWPEDPEATFELASGEPRISAVSGEGIGAAG